MREDICPTCKSKSCIYISVSSSDGYVHLHSWDLGGVTLCACKDCGTVYLRARDLEKLKGENDE